MTGVGSRGGGSKGKGEAGRNDKKVYLYGCGGRGEDGSMEGSRGVKRREGRHEFEGRGFWG